MNSKGLRINNVEVDTEILNALLNQDKKIEAIKYIVEHCNTGLKEAKDFIDNYDSDNIELNADLNFPKKEGVQIKTLKNTIEVRYRDKFGNETLVNPDHPLWNNVKLIMRDSLKIKEYEDAFYKEKNETRSNSNPIIIQENNSGKLLLISVIVIVIIALAYFLIP